ncbi:hypothetical protein R3P38DRAFT_53515 [Favolaschia claudopus]|uniref:F-box domain-containing protein n=1 Tax=Favolaschia claudopus TaxID=2862362 RepID=A0AAW0EJ83_9AGAR
MPFVPQELIDAIVGEIEDMQSLKACALAGTMFRDPCQRILLHSLALDDSIPKVAAASALLQSSPHIAIHVTHLEIRFGTSINATITDSSDMTSLDDVLDKLMNVDHCTLIIGIENCVIPIDSISNFLVRQPLHRLKICHFYSIPPVTLARLLVLAPVVVFSSPEPLLKFYSRPSWNIERQPAPNVEDLFIDFFQLDMDCERFAQILPTPALRRLFTCMDYDRCRHLIAANASTLEHLHIRLRIDTLVNTVTPPLPLLRFVEIQVIRPYYRILSPSGLLDLIQSFISTSPLITHITLCLLPSPYLDLKPQGDFLPLPALDALLSADHSRPAIHWHWRIDFCSPTGPAGFANDIDAQSKQFDEFANKVRNGMGRAYAEGRLKVERFDYFEDIERKMDGFWSRPLD